MGRFFCKAKKIINIDTPGILCNLISELEKENIEELNIIGKLNGSDFKILRDMATNKNLSFLDLSNTNIVNGGDYYYMNYSTKHFTKNNIFGYSLFNGCKKIEKIILPKSIEEIGQCAFWYCKNLKTIIIHSNVKIIEPGLFGGCSELKDIQIIDNPNFHLENGIIYNKYYTKIIAALQTTIHGELNIRNGIQKIEYNSFSGCKSLTRVIFPSSLTELEDNSFSESNLKSIIFNSNIKSICIFCFSLCYNLKEFNLIKIKINKL